MNLLFFAVPFVIGALLCAIFLPIGTSIARQKHLFDEINERKSHTVATPRIGGIIFVPVLLFTVFVSAGILIPEVQSTMTMVKYGFLKHIAYFFAAWVLIYLIGWIDDFRGVRYKWKFLVQIIAAVLLILGGYYFYHLGGLFGIGRIPKPFAYPLTLLIIVAIINAYNLVDGIDGLCSCLGLIAVTFLDYCFIRNGMVMQTILASSTIGVFSVFCLFNVFITKSKTFMGDTGSMSLGFIIAFLILSLYCGNYWHSHIYSLDPLKLWNPFAVVLGAVFHPAFDMCRVFFTRLFKGRPVFAPDRLHFHHKLLDMGLTHIQATLIICAIQCFFILLNWILAGKKVDTNVIVAVDLAVAVTVWQVVNAVYRRVAGLRHDKQ